MRIDKKQKKKEFVLKIIVTFGLVNFNRSNHYEQQDNKSLEKTNKKGQMSS